MDHSIYLFVYLAKLLINLFYITLPPSAQATTTWWQLLQIKSTTEKGGRNRALHFSQIEQG